MATRAKCVTDQSTAKSKEAQCTDPEPHIPGFPTLPLSAVGRLLCLVADGRGVKRACEETGICRDTFYSALREYKPLADNYTRAREMEADLDADEVKEIADDPELAPDEKRVRIDSRKWSAGVRKPKVYGPKVEITEVAPPLTPAAKRERAVALAGRIEQLRGLLK